MGTFPTGAKGFARVDTRRPVAFAICDRCGQRYNRTDLTWQFDWRGAQLQNLRLLVCKRKCLDVPQEQLRSYSPPPDPLPIANARPDLSVMGAPVIVTTVAAGSSSLLAANAARSYVALAMPPAWGVSINPTGGAAGPGQAGATFYAPGSVFEISGAAAQSAMSYWCAAAGLPLVVQVD